MAERNNQFDFNIYHSSTELPASFDLLRIIYIVEGSCRVFISQETVQLPKGGILLLNPMEEARIEADESMLAAVLEIPFFEL